MALLNWLRRDQELRLIRQQLWHITNQNEAMLSLLRGENADNIRQQTEKLAASAAALKAAVDAQRP